MSYNISNWSIKKVHLELPIDFDFQKWLETQPDRDENGYENRGKRWCTEDMEYNILSIDFDASIWKLCILADEDEPTLSGVIENNKLVTRYFNGWTEDFSGDLYDDILLPLFEEFNGTLEARVVWEHGDSVKRLKICNGAVKETEIE